MTPQNLTCHKKTYNSGIDTLVGGQPVVPGRGRGDVQMGRRSVAYLVASLVIWALADGVSPGRVVNQRVLAWDVPVIATQTLPAAAVQQSGGDDNLVQVLTGLVGDEVVRVLSRNRGRIGAGLLVVTVLGVALIVRLVVEMKKREARVKADSAAGVLAICAMSSRCSHKRFKSLRLEMSPRA